LNAEVGKRYEVPYNGSLTTQKAPKYSKDFKAVSSAFFTLNDEPYLEKKALAWRLRYKK
jgi:hypothetical protein